MMRRNECWYSIAFEEIPKVFEMPLTRCNIKKINGRSVLPAIRETYQIRMIPYSFFVSFTNISNSRLLADNKDLHTGPPY